MQANVLREKFLNFFKSKKHKIVESDSLVPKDDPTVLFTPAGMNQFKKQFLGDITDFRRAATSQRCLRTDDLDKVGKTTGHHTFFEMLGNFSFGDYFKEEAIAYAWEFLTGQLKIKKELLWISVYKDDDDAYNIWKDKINIPVERIIKLGDKDNFWPSQARQKGPNGPCGPCSEIFFDFGADKGCGKQDCSPACSCGRFVEIWNLVFTQFNRKEGGILEPLPQKNIDTGMGLERLTAVMQKAPNNFETDLFKPLMKEIVSAIKIHPSNETEATDAVSDHIRAIAFGIYDGILPSNEGRGYVIRKLIRKSVLHLKTLGIEKPFLYKLVAVLSEVMNEPYPELSKRRENISEIILAEEKNFINTLKSSDTLIKNILEPLSSKGINSDTLGGAAFQLYDTHGIPLDLTFEWLKKSKVEFSKEALLIAFNKALEEQKNRSKITSVMKGDVFGAKDLKLDAQPSKFLGYKNNQSSAKILAIIADDKLTKKITKGGLAKIILDKTPFYAESGGQAGDKGVIIRGKNTFEVLDTQKAGSVIIHIGRVNEGSFKKHDDVLAKIDIETHLSIARNHTATHLLQAALRAVLGAHVQQQGSLVAYDKLRFDFTHFKDITDEELNRIETAVNEYIISNYPVSSKEMSIAAAKRTGALAFFAEKYENKVRVVSTGNFSKEFCGGTHLDSTGQIGIFKIIHEGSIASGVRRIEAVTAREALKVIKKKEDILAGISGVLKVRSEMLEPELQKKLARIKELEKKVYSQKLNSIEDSIAKLLEKKEALNNISIISAFENDKDMDTLRKSVDLVKVKTDKTVIALGSQDTASSRALLVIGLTPDLLQKGLDAGTLIRDISKYIGGSGGGRKDFAQAGGNNPAGFSKAFEELKTLVQKYNI